MNAEKHLAGLRPAKGMSPTEASLQNLLRLADALANYQQKHGRRDVAAHLRRAAKHIKRALEISRNNPRRTKGRIVHEP